MTTLSDPILAGKTDPSTDFLKAYTISGGLQEVEDKVKELGWLGDSPVATVAIYFQDGGSDIHHGHQGGWKDLCSHSLG